MHHLHFHQVDCHNTPFGLDCIHSTTNMQRSAIGAPSSRNMGNTQEGLMNLPDHLQGPVDSVRTSYHERISMQELYRAAYLN